MRVIVVLEVVAVLTRETLGSVYAIVAAVHAWVAGVSGVVVEVTH